MKVTIPAPTTSIIDYVVFHIKDNNRVENLVASYANGKISFETDSFSCFVVAERKVTYSFTALVTEGGTITYNDEIQEGGYFGENLEAGAKVTLTATAKTGYEFMGWFEREESMAGNAIAYKATPISTTATYEFTIPAREYNVCAMFTAKITGLILDGANAGFSTISTTTTVTIGDESLPNPEEVIVKGDTVADSVILNKTTDYTIDDGDLDFTTAGTYTITYTYVKDTTIKATLTVEVVTPKYDFTALVTEGGTITYNDEIQEGGYFGENLEAGAKVTLTATAKTGYEFKGWFEREDSMAGNAIAYKTTPISTTATYEFTIPASEYNVCAMFTAKITGLILDGANAGFSTISTTTTVTIGDESLPNPEEVIVKGETVADDVILTKTTDYTIDDGDLDFTTAGTYTITYTYVKDTTIKATLTVEVIKKASTQRLVYRYDEESSEAYNGGLAADVFKEAFQLDGENCKWSDLVDTYAYEWRDANTDVVVEPARDITIETAEGDGDALFPGPAKVGTYNFVVYEKSDLEKNPIIKLTRTITTSDFKLVELESSFDLRSTTNYAIIAKVGENYYAMSTPLAGAAAGECDAIIVERNSKGIIALGSNYEYVFRPYESDKNPTEYSKQYFFRTGEGPYSKRGNINLWGGTADGRIQFSSDTTSADNTHVITFDSVGGPAIIKNFVNNAQIRLVYDAESEKYLFTAKDPAVDVRTSYDVYIYAEYKEEPAPETNVYELAKTKILSKTYDENAVIVDMFKDIIINNNTTNWSNVEKAGAKVLWTDLKGNEIDGTSCNGKGMAIGPSAVGKYRFVIQETKDGGKTYTELFSVEFEISAAE